MNKRYNEKNQRWMPCVARDIKDECDECHDCTGKDCFIAFPDDIYYEEKETRFSHQDRKSVKVAVTAITAALYIALGYAFQPFSFMGLQFRVAELMVGMCILFPLPGLYGNMIGVFILNLSSPLGLLDALLGPIVNAVALGFITQWRKGRSKYLGGTLYAVIISYYVAWLLNYVLGLPFWLMFIQVFISELILATLGIALFTQIGKHLEVIDQ